MLYNISDSKGLTGTHCEDRVYEILSIREYSLDTTIGLSQEQAIINSKQQKYCAIYITVT